MKKQTSFSKFRLKVHARVPGYLGQYEEEVEKDAEESESEKEAFGTEEDEWNNFGNEEDDETGRSSFACEDCDHRWEDYYNVEAMSDVPSCPMCGSNTVVEL